MAGEIIGRREELRSLRTFLTALPDGGQALLLEGDPGIGKTTLWDEGVCAARENDYRVLTARPAQSETQIAFATVGDLFAPALLETLPRLAPLQRRALETALLLRESEGSPPDARALGLAIHGVVRALADDRPVLLALDDLQWVDNSSAVVLGFALRRLDQDPVGVLATVRGRPVDLPLELDRNLTSFERLSVEPLSIGAIHRLLWGRLALNLPRPVIARVHDTSGGNPFFALELGRALVEGTIRVDSTTVALPESLRALVAQRLDRLPVRARETLVAVAALASPSVTVIAPLSPSAVDDIELAQSQGLLELDGDRIRFTHPLLAPACYEAMPLHRRRQLHRRVANLDIDPEERARHLAIAAVSPDENIAAALDAAASHAHGRGAAQVAAELAERAVALTPTDAVEMSGRRRIAAASHCVYAGDMAKAGALLEDVVEGTAPGPLRAEALRRLAGVAANTEGNPSAERLLRRALAEPGVEIGQRADILGSLASQASVKGDSRTALQYAKEGLALAEDLGDPETLASALTTLADITFWRTGQIQRGLLVRAIDLGRAEGPRMALAFQLGRADHYEEARANWLELIAEMKERADPQVVVYLFFLARMEVSSGDWDTAERLCDEAMSLGRQIGRQMDEQLCLMILAEINAYRGRAEKSRSEIPDLVRTAEAAGYGGAVHRLSRALGSLELCCGDAAASWRQVAPLFADVTELDEVRAQLAGSVAIEALVGIDDLPAAEQLLALLDERAATSDTALRSLADRCRGLVLAARGEYEAAIDALEAAAEIPDRPQEANPLEQGRTRLALGTVQRQARHKRAARVTLMAAAESFESLGAVLWAEKARSELRRIGGRTASEHDLSETELRIVELVVAGRRNREVAAELSLSPNTVAWNLSKVYRKLGVSSRTELAAHIAATPPP